MIPVVHPFPARMAPELALEGLKDLRLSSIVLDPMAGSGTVLRHASEAGHDAIGFDLDPLAVLMSRVWTQPFDQSALQDLTKKVMREALAASPQSFQLPWIDNDKETSAFIKFWFGPKQIAELRCLAFILERERTTAVSFECQRAIDVLRIALSRIIITKEQCASLARDTSHSRPHRVTLTSDYSVFEGFHRSIKMLEKRLLAAPAVGQAHVALGDARRISLDDQSVDAVLTSPPYLNAIDYMRGHRLSLVWLGHRLSDLRAIRSTSIGSERGTDASHDLLEEVRREMGNIDLLAARHRSMIDRYILDIAGMVRETYRVLKPGGSATFVVGNSCLRGIFISNANVVAKTAELSGFKSTRRYERELPERNRYLPLSAGSLAKRMRTETILSFAA